jgi:hypothetical protein
MGSVSAQRDLAPGPIPAQSTAERLTKPNRQDRPPVTDRAEVRWVALTVESYNNRRPSWFLVWLSPSSLQVALLRHDRRSLTGECQPLLATAVRYVVNKP